MTRASTCSASDWTRTETSTKRTRGPLVVHNSIMIDTREIESAQETWGKAVVEIGTAPSPHEARALATRLAEDHYLIGEGNLLLCPTRASKRQFRTSLKGIVSYLVGGDPDYAEDRGFALEPWTAVRFENAGTIERADVGIAMGNYFFVRADGSGLKAEYSFVYVRGADGGLKIQLHHSALPFEG